MVSREGGLFPPPPLTSMVGHFGRSVLVRIHIRAVFFLVRQCLHYTEELFVSTQKAIRYTVKTIRYVTLQFRDPRGADSLSQRNRVEITVLMCEQNPCLVWLLWRRKSFPVYWEHYLSFSISVFYFLFFFFFKIWTRLLKAFYEDNDRELAQPSYFSLPIWFIMSISSASVIL